MATGPSPIEDAKPLTVRRGRVESVDLYEIKDSELDELEKGTPAELQFNFAVFLFSLAFSAIASLTTATFANPIIRTTFIVVAVVGCILSTYFFVAWWRTKSTVAELCKRIRLRIPPELSRARGAPGVVDDNADSKASGEEVKG